MGAKWKWQMLEMTFDWLGNTVEVCLTLTTDVKKSWVSDWKIWVFMKYTSIRDISINALRQEIWNTFQLNIFLLKVLRQEIWFKY